MQDPHRILTFSHSCILAQEAFDRRAADYRAACVAVDAARAAQATASAALRAAFDDVCSADAAAHNHGVPVPNCLRETSFWRSIHKGRELAIIDAALEAHAPPDMRRHT